MIKSHSTRSCCFIIYLFIRYVCCYFRTPAIPTGYEPSVQHWIDIHLCREMPINHTKDHTLHIYLFLQPRQCRCLPPLGNHFSFLSNFEWNKLLQSQPKKPTTTTLLSPTKRLRSPEVKQTISGPYKGRTTMRLGHLRPQWFSGLWKSLT